MSTQYQGPETTAALPCGRLYDDLIEQVADRLAPADPAHQSVCPHCRATLAELGDLWSPVHDLSTEETVAPDSLTRNIMERVIALAGNTWYALVVDNPGINLIASWVIALVARRAALTVPGVLEVRGRADSPDPGDPAGTVSDRPTSAQRLAAAGAGVAGRRVVLDLLVTADGTVALPLIAKRIRTAVVDLVRALTGLEVIEVNIEFADIAFGDSPETP